jgi:hypothetical protein
MIPRGADPATAAALALGFGTGSSSAWVRGDLMINVYGYAAQRAAEAKPSGAGHDKITFVPIDIQDQR